MKSTIIRFRIEPERLDQLDEKLKQDGYTSRSEWFNQILREYLKGVDKK